METDGAKPELGDSTALLDVHVRRLVAFTAVEKESKAFAPEQSRHP
jgi:hypothetical protein